MGLITSVKLNIIIISVILASNLCLGEKYAIIHWNDISGQMQRFYPGTVSDSSPASCTNNDASCVGGLVNILHHVDAAYNEATDIAEEHKFRLTSGNLVGGENGWLSVLGWEAYGRLIEEFYKPTAMSIGTKEFGAGIKRTISYLSNTTSETTPIVLTNLNCASYNDVGSSEFEFCHRIKPLHQLTNTIGLLGFINPTASLLGSTGDLEFDDIVTSLKRVTDHPSNQGIKTFIASGDGSLAISKQIIEKVPKVKLVIYGRSFGSSSNMNGNYPLKYKSGYIATAGSYGSSIGKLILDIDSNGNIASTSGSKLIPTSGLNIDNVEATKRVNEFAAKIEAEGEEILGHTVFKLEGGKRCWRNECNLGNLVTDAMVHCALNNGSSSEYEKIPLVSIWHGGALFDDEVKPNSLITKMDVHKWLPFHNRPHLVRISGSDLWKVFEGSALGLTANTTDVKDWGQFLQVSSGLEVYYSTKGQKPEVQRIRILHEEDSTPVMKDIDRTKPDYYVVIPSFIHEGRSVYGFAKNYWKPVSSNFAFDDDCVEDYVRALGMLSVGFEERIWINDPDGIAEICSESKGANTAVTVILTIVIMAVILGAVFVGYFYVYPRLTGRQGSRFRNFSNA